ncbi:choice-of-anchor L domain-containing protein, partial [Halocola ammonii]
MLTSYNSPDSRLRNRIVKFSLIVSLVFIASISFGQLTTDESLPPEEIVQGFFDSGLMITNVEFNGEPEQLGNFDCQNCGIGLTDGFIITNGSVENAEGPNDGPGASHSASMENFYEEDLLTIYPEMSLVINDVTTLEFDFVAAGDSVWFDYVFASEEYNEYIDSSGFAVSDPFGVFVSGPGIDGQFSNGGKNIALIPGTDDYVQIENLNNGENNNGPCVNCEYFITNPADPDDPESVQYDGYSTVLTAGIGGLQAGETYHMKIAIADVYDNSYDTGIFFGNQSLHSNKKFVSFHNGEEEITESNPISVCQTAYLEVVRVSPLNLADTVHLINTDNTNGEQGFYFSLLSEENIVIPPGESKSEIEVHTPINNYGTCDGSSHFLHSFIYYENMPDSLVTIDDWATLYALDSILTPSLPDNLILEDTVALCDNEGHQIQTEEFDYSWFNLDWGIQNVYPSFLGNGDSLLVSPNQTTTYIFTAEHECSDFSVADTITLDLPVNLNVELSPDSSSLIAQEDFAHFQWLDCN